MFRIMTITRTLRSQGDSELDASIKHWTLRFAVLALFVGGAKLAEAQTARSRAAAPPAYYENGQVAPRMSSQDSNLTMPGAPEAPIPVPMQTPPAVRPLASQPPELPSTDVVQSEDETDDLNDTLLPIDPPAAIAPSDLTNMTASLGATRGLSSAAPNMIGDLFNSGTSSLNFNVKFQIDPIFTSGNGAIATNPNSLVTGVNASIAGVTVTALSPIGDLVRTGQSSSISVSDLDPINSVNVQVTTSSDASAVLNGAGTGVNPSAPAPNSLIFEAANRAIARELSTGFSNSINIEDLLDLQYLRSESTINGGNGQVTGVSYRYQAAVNLPVPSPGEVVGRYSIADNNSPLPQDRLFLDYNFFHNARITASGIPVNRWAPGFEKTFADQLFSIEMRAPMAVTLTSSVNTSGEDLAAFEFGDTSFTLKSLLYGDDRLITSAGLGVTIPTADDFTLTLKDNTPVVRVENQSVHLLPFIAGSLMMTQNTFTQTFGQVDFDTNGNSVFLNEQGFLMQGAGSLTNQGRLRSQTTLRLSNSVGAFLFRNRKQRVSSLAAVMEAHYTGTLNRSDAVGSPNFSIGDPTRTLNVLNLTTGMHAYVGKSVFTAAYGVPVTEDRVFDGELRLFVNRYF